MTLSARLPGIHEKCKFWITSCALAFFAAAGPAYAVVSATMSANFPSAVSVNQTFQVTMTITDTSTGLDEFDPKDVTNIKLVPACYNIVGGACANWDTGVFEITNPVNVNCGFVPTTFTVNANGLATGVYVFTPSSGFVIFQGSPYASCSIQFDVAVKAMPAHDADAGAPGIQTFQVMSADLFDEDNQNSGLAQGNTTTTFARPLFVIGDVEPHAVGDTVNFWGAQWWKNNSMSGLVSAGVASFKGYATDADNFCGGTWESRPGNSSDPPDTIPDDVMVIVTTTVNKDGPDITGDIKQIVLVHSDGGYGPAPGHRGNGEVTTVLCK